MAADDGDRLAAADPVGDGGLEPLADEGDLEVVGHAAVHRDERRRAWLDGRDRVDGDRTARDHAPARFDQDAGVARQMRASRVDENVEVLVQARGWSV